LETFTDRVYTIKRYSGVRDPQLAQDIEAFQEYLSSLQDKTSYARSMTTYFDDPDHPNHTEYCQSVRPFDDLVFDIIRWKNERFPETRGSRA